MIGRFVAFAVVRGFVAEFESSAIAAERLEFEATADFVARVGIVAGFVFEIPFVIYVLARSRAGNAQIPRPSRRFAVFIFVLTTALFFAGAMFAWFVVLHFTLKFLTEFSPADIRTSLSASSFADFVIKMPLAVGLVFETPLVIYLLARLCIIKTRALRRSRRTRLWLSPSSPPLSLPPPFPSP